ncbi:ATP-dependent helicase DinG/Rad3 [Vibrio maritimus]|uniref:ATP-dependent helicase DinG/Rad3 n=1 Tax=Vibrio maritimus TaxID=990268 RepID=A0A090RXW1_9VIBR|nr:ATP-dependent helicase DinG/Rad3 [Vibrio maritimus]
MIVAEAGTGIGKSLSYLMATIPVAVQNNRKIVISTATVALQEQLLNKDLPLFRRITDQNFSFIIAKGRQRYCCAEKLAVPAARMVVKWQYLKPNPRHQILPSYSSCMKNWRKVNGMVIEIHGQSPSMTPSGKPL